MIMDHQEMDAVVLYRPTLAGNLVCCHIHLTARRWA